MPRSAGSSCRSTPASWSFAILKCLRLELCIGCLESLHTPPHALFRPNVDLLLTTRSQGIRTLCPNHFNCGSAMVLKAESKYPNRRAYVLKLRGDATPDALAGRIENLVTGDQVEFASAPELLECLTRDLDAAASERALDVDA